ncbi:MAG: GAF domain-containing protein [Coriobacteriia bacterium]|nr:GAF domain-containing protein [Coriobacteriia bacterium]
MKNGTPDAENPGAAELATSALLLEASRALAMWTEPARTLQALADIMLKATRHSRVTVYTWHEETLKMRVDAVAGSSPLPLGMEVDFDDFAPGTRAALSAQRTAFVDLTKVPPEQRPIGEAWGYCDVLAVPLVFVDRLVGMIGIDNVGTHRPFTEREIKIAEGIAAQAAAAITNAGLFQRQRDELANTRLLQDVAVAGAEALRIGDVCNRVLEELHEHLDLQLASIFLLDAQAEHLILTASIGYPEEVKQSIRRLPVSDDSNIGRLVVHQLAFLTHEHGSDPPGALERIRRLGLEASRWIALPIKHGNDLLGAVSLVFPKRSSFREQEIDLFRGVAATLGSAVSNAQLFEAERRARAREEVRASHLDTLNAIAAACLTSLSSMELAGELLPLIKGRIGFSSATVRVLSPGGGSLVLLACDGISPEEVAEPIDLSGDCVICDAFRTGEPIIQSTGSEVVSGYASQTPDAPRDGTRAFAVLPLVGPSQTIGMLTMSWRGPRAWPDERVAFLGSVANEFAVGLENARLHEREREAARLAAAFAEINSAVHSTLDFDEIADRALTEGARTLGAENATIAMRSEAGFLLSHAYGHPQASAGSFVADTPNNSYSLALRLKKTVAIDDVAGDPRVSDAVARERCPRSIISAPLITQSAGSALLNFSFSTKTHSFTSAECDFVTNVASSLALALENASLFSAEVRAQFIAKEELDLSNLLLQATNTLSSSIDLSRITEALCDVTCRTLRIGRARVLLFDAEHGVFRVAASCSSGDPIDTPTLRWDELPATLRDSALREPKAPVLIDCENACLPEIEHVVTPQDSILRGAWVPIRTSDKHLGFVVTDEPGQRYDFSERDLEIASAFASQAAVSIQNALLYQTEHHIAETLQHALLEVPEHILGLEHGELYRSATETAHVGGDFYDLFEIDRGRIGVAIGDVSGKGLDAASLTATVRNTLRVHALEGLAPSTVVRKTNDLLIRFTPIEVFVTLFFGILDTRTGALSYVVAGHPAPLVMHGSGDVDELAGGSPIVGAFEGIAFEEHAATLRWADTLLLYTDGLAEVRCGAEQYGIRRVAAALTANHAASGDLARLVRLVCADAQAFSGGALNDDMALMAIRLQHGPE